MLLSLPWAWPAAAAAQHPLPSPQCRPAQHLRLHGAHDELRVLTLPVDDLADVSQLVLDTQQLPLKNINLKLG
jgi:hypothetical protein